MQTQESLMKEIFITPSTETCTGRFDAENTQAVCKSGCSGKCASAFEEQNKDYSS